MSEEDCPAERILVTGASGFVGRAVVARLAKEIGLHVRGAYRSLPQSPQPGVEVCLAGDLGTKEGWEHALADSDVVVHCAARVHVLQDASADPLFEYRSSNVKGTLSLARAAHEAGCRRFVFISSIKVHGEFSPPGLPITETSEVAPEDPYGISKLEAETGLFALARETGLEVVVIRPPLVYGPGVRANFLSMMRWVSRGLPLPLGAIQNRRSLVGLANLVELIAVCCHHPSAANEVFLVSDGDDVSTPELVRCIAGAMGVRAHLFSVPVWLLKIATSFVGYHAQFQRLTGSLEVDIGKARDLLGWSPGASMSEELVRTVDDFRRDESHA